MRVLRIIFFFMALAAPWLNPFAPGPSAAMVPWLVSLGCVGLGLLALPLQLPLAQLPRWVHVFFALVAVYFAGHLLWSGPHAEGWGALLAWGCVWAMLLVGTALGWADHAAMVDAEDSPLEPRPAHSYWVRHLAALWLAVALVSVALALVQYLQLEQWVAPWISQSADGTAYANLRQRNQFATLCGMGLCALLYLQQTCAIAPRPGTLHPLHPLHPLHSVWQRVWPWLAATVLAVGTALSCSRTGALQWLLLAAAVLCWRSSLRPRVQWLALGALALYAVAVGLMPLFADWVGNTSTGLLGRAQEGMGGNSRVWLYSNVLQLIAEKPLLGWGWRELAYAHYGTHFTQRFGELLDNAHNLPLHLAVELGTPFALAVCAVLGWATLRAAPWRESDATRQLAWLVLLLLGVHSLVEYPLWYGPFIMSLGLAVGLLIMPFYKQNSDIAPVNTAQTAMQTVAFCMVFFATYAGFDYHRVSQIYLTPEQRSAAYRNTAMAAAQQSRIYQVQAEFAELVTTELSRASAPRLLALSLQLMHYSPEPRVIEALIESATMLGVDDLALFHLGRYKEAYPEDYAQWTVLRRGKTAPEKVMPQP
jgi:hypothetical protein